MRTDDSKPNAYGRRELGCAVPPDAPVPHGALRLASEDHAATSHDGQSSHHHHSHAAHSSHAGGHHLLQLDDVSIGFERYTGRGALAARETRFVVEHLNLSVHAGEILALVGASGSGKTLIADAVMGLFAANSVVTGRIWFDGALMDERSLASLRGRQIAFVPQSVEALDPLQRVGRQIERLAHGMPRREAAVRRRELFARYRLDEGAARRYPFELSGGMARRALLAGALMNDPKVIVADEPTPGLDLELAVRAMDDFRTFADAGGGVLLITHDIELALRVADRIAVFKGGTVVEETAVSNFASPDLLQHPFSRELWHALPANLNRGRAPHSFSNAVPDPCSDSTRLLQARGVRFGYGGRPVLDGVDVAVAPGERVALRAPSGTGKTTLCRILAGYLQPQRGSVLVDGEPLPRRGASPVQLIAQHPERMLDPAITLRASLREAAVSPEDAAALDAWAGQDGLQRKGARADADPEGAETGFAGILDALGVQPTWLDRFPSELSGGELQRCCVARALAVRPRYLVCDEISTMLDAVTQARLWRFLIDHAQANGIGMVLVSHSDELLARIATRVIDLAGA